MGMLYVLLVKMGKTSYANHATLKSALENYEAVPLTLGMNRESFEHIVKDLYERKGRSLVVAGGPVAQTSQCHFLQIAVNFLNHLLENDGSTVDFSQAPFVGHSSSHQNLVHLLSDMEAGKIKVLLIHKTNPLYFLSGSSHFEEALKKVPLVLYSGNLMDETGRKADFILPDHHSMEKWGDMEAQKGIYAIQQPTLRPLYETRSFEQSLLHWIALFRKQEKAEDWYNYLRRQWQKREGWPAANLEKAWVELLQKGISSRQTEKTREAHQAPRSFRSEAVQELLNVSPSFHFSDSSDSSASSDSNASSNSKDEILKEQEELVLYPTSHLQDGSLANVAWLQELPDNVTKICWDNYLSISPEMAKQHQLKDGSVVELKLKLKQNENHPLRLPVFIQAGQHPKVLALALGYGQAFGGKVAKGVGQNAYKIVNLMQPRGNVSVKLEDEKESPKEPTYNDSTYRLQLEFVITIPALSSLPLEWKVVKGASYPLANVQGHHYLEGRPILHEFTYQEHVKKHLHLHKGSSSADGGGDEEGLKEKKHTKHSEHPTEEKHKETYKGTYR